jgi:hypothetical protein
MHKIHFYSFLYARGLYICIKIQAMGWFLKVSGFSTPCITINEIFQREKGKILSQKYNNKSMTSRWQRNHAPSPLIPAVWSDLNMNLSLSGATDFVEAKAKTSGIKVFIPKLLCYTVFMKKACTFLLKLYVFLCVSCQFSRVFVSFNISIFVSLALKIHDCTDLKLVRKQHWNFNEFNFYIW